MQINRIVVDQWRGFSNARIDFASDGYTVLSGPNNAGKSLLLDAAERVAMGKPLDEGGLAAVAWVIEDHDELLRSSPKKNTSARYLDMDVRGIVRRPADPKEELFVLLSQAVAAGLRPPQKQSAFHSELAAVRLRDDGGQGDGLVIQSSKSSNQTVADSVSSEMVARLRDLSTTVAYRLPTIRPGSARSIPAEATPHLAPDGSNLPHVLLWLQTRDGSGWRRVRDFFEAVFPNAGRLLAEVSAQEVEIVVNDATTDVDRNLKDLGTGLEQLILVAVACETQAPGSLVIIG